MLITPRPLLSLLSLIGCVAAAVGVVMGHTGYHACWVRPCGAIQCFGKNQWGQCGSASGGGGEAMRAPGEAVPLGMGAVGVAEGANHTCALLTDGRVQCWGDEAYGVLGDGPLTPIQGTLGFLGSPMTFAHPPVAIAAGSEFSCVLLGGEGDVWCWGRKYHGPVGHPSEAIAVPTPSRVDLGPCDAARAITAGFRFMCAIRMSGSVVCWGDNWFGQLGRGNTTTVPHQDGGMGCALVDVNLGPGRTAKEIAAGRYHVCALLDNDAILCWGRNEVGQLGRGHTETIGDDAGEMQTHGWETTVDLGNGRTPLTVSSGGRFTCALTINQQNEREVMCWGNNEHAQRGTGTINDPYTGLAEPAMIPTNFGPGRYIKDIRLSRKTVCLVIDDGRVLCWGSNVFGSVGTGSDEKYVGNRPSELGNSLVPVAFDDQSVADCPGWISPSKVPLSKSTKTSAQCVCPTGTTNVGTSVISSTLSSTSPSSTLSSTSPIVTSTTSTGTITESSPTTGTTIIPTGTGGVTSSTTWTGQSYLSSVATVHTTTIVASTSLQTSTPSTETTFMATTMTETYSPSSRPSPTSNDFVEMEETHRVGTTVMVICATVGLLLALVGALLVRKRYRTRGPVTTCADTAEETAVNMENPLYARRIHEWNNDPNPLFRDVEARQSYPSNLRRSTSSLIR